MGTIEKLNSNARPSGRHSLGLVEPIGASEPAVITYLFGGTSKDVEQQIKHLQRQKQKRRSLKKGR